MKRVKNYLMIALLYGCSLYHFIFSIGAIIFGSQFEKGGEFPLDNFLFKYYGVQEYMLRTTVLPIYAFETFTLMTFFIVIDYWIRKSIRPQISMRRFLDAFLFSQLAYIGYIYRLIYYINGTHAVWDGIFFWLVDIPMFIVSFPLSLFLFEKRLQQTVVKKILDMENDKKENREIVFDYLLFLGGTLAFAIISYLSNHH